MGEVGSYIVFENDKVIIRTPTKYQQHDEQQQYQKQQHIQSKYIFE